MDSCTIMLSMLQLQDHILWAVVPLCFLSLNFKTFSYEQLYNNAFYRAVLRPCPVEVLSSFILSCSFETLPCGKFYLHSSYRLLCYLILWEFLSSRFLSLSFENLLYGKFYHYDSYCAALRFCPVLH